jgi:hypothetical protein
VAAIPAAALQGSGLAALTARTHIGAYRLTGEFLVAGSAALCLALKLPVATTVFGLILFGLLHNFFEIRYVLGRFSGLLGRSLLLTLLAPLTAIAILRLLPLGLTGSRIEVGALYLLLALVWSWKLRQGPYLLLAAGLGLLAVAAALSIEALALYFVVLIHLHNLLPLFFLWEWAGRLPGSGQRVAFRGAHVVWTVIVPACILTGVFDGLIQPNVLPGTTFVGDPWRFAASYTPPAWWDGVLPFRCLTAFAFLQSMHYVVWCWFFPHAGKAEAARSDRFLGSLAARLVGWRLKLAVAGMVLVLGALFWTDYSTGKSLYSALATYHAYLEFPVVLAFLLAVRW